MNDAFIYLRQLFVLHLRDSLPFPSHKPLVEHVLSLVLYPRPQVLVHVLHMSHEFQEAVKTIKKHLSGVRGSLWTVKSIFARQCENAGYPDAAVP